VKRTLFVKRTLYRNSAIALAVLLVGASIANAQASKPVVVVTIPGYDELMADVDFLSGLGGRPGVSQMADGMLKMMTQGQGLKGLDKTKPIGLVVTLENGMPTPSVVVPVTNAKDLLSVLIAVGQGQVGPVSEEGGTFKVGVPNGDSVYVRENAGWAYITQAKDAPLPEDPSKSIAGLSKDYDVAVRVYLQNVPSDQKKKWTEQFRSLMQMVASMQQAQAGDNPLAKLGQNNVQAQVAAIEKLLNEADQVTIGWKLDRQAKNTHLDFTVTAVPGSQMDQQMQKMANAKTNFAGFLKPDSAVMGCVSGTNTPDQIEQAVSTLQELKTKMEEAIDKDSNLKDDKARAQVKAVAGKFLDVIVKTVKTGKSDGGGVLMLAPNTFQLAIGGFIADGPGLESAVKDLVQLAKGEPEFNNVATVKFDVATYKDVKFHQVNIKLPPEADESAKKIFGDAVELYIGAGPDSAYVALGKGSMDLVKSVMDKSTAEPNKPVQPFQLSIALTPILKFAASVNPNDPHVSMVAQQFEQAKGKDHILVNAKPISNGMTYRLEVEDGVIEAIGQISRTAMQQQGGPAGGFGFGPGN
jgi:hypothetical protein